MNVLVIKCGSALRSLVSERGPLPRWILSPMGVGREEASIADVREGDGLPGHDAVSAVVVTGSPAYTTDHPDWAERTAEWLREAVTRGLPTLGLCFGHQLLAYALGGEVALNPSGREIGTVELRLTGKAQVDPLLGSLPPTFPVQVSHRQTVLRLPEGAVHLAYSQGDQHQAFRIDGQAWGLQFHPEFDRHIMSAYIRYHADDLRAEGFDPERLLVACQETPIAREILRRFGALARGHTQAPRSESAP